MRSPEHQAYLDGFKGLLGTKQLPQHLQSVDKWWTLRDDEGRTPLMLAIRCKGASPEVFRAPGADLIRDAVDNNGHNLWFHLFKARRRMRTKELLPWTQFLGTVPPITSPITQRGWIIENVCQNPRHNGAGEVPSPEAQKTWAQLTEGPAHLWWACREPDAQVFLKWITNIRFPHAREARAMDDFVTATLQWPHTKHTWMPTSLNDALMFNSLIAGNELGDEWVTAKHERGEYYPLSKQADAILQRNLDQFEWSPVTKDRMQLFFVRNRQLQLQDKLDAYADQRAIATPSRKPRF